MTTDTKTPLATVLEQYETKQRSHFRPKPEFYDEMGISHIRFGKLLKGTAVITGQEAKTLANFFGVPVNDLI